MEEEMKGKKVSISVILLIIALIVIVVMGFFMEKLFNDKKAATDKVAQLYSQSNSLQNTVNNLQGTIDSVADTINSSKSEIATDNKVMSADERYKAYITGLKNNLKSINEYGEIFDGKKVDACLYYNGDILKFAGVNCIYLKNNGDVYVELSENSYLGKKHGTNYKIASNIVRVGVTNDGQDGDGVYMINDEGKFYYCEFHGVGADSSENSLEFKEITKLKNIVNVENLNNGETMIPFAFDIDGNIYDISKLK